MNNTAEREYYERCVIGYRENGMPIFQKDPTLTEDELKIAKRIWNAEYHKIYNRTKGSSEGETYSQKYYKENKEKVYKMNQDYKERHPEKFKQYKRETYFRHREKYLERAKRYYEKNKERISAREKARYVPNGNPKGRPRKHPQAPPQPKTEGAEGVDILVLLQSHRAVEAARSSPKVNLLREYSVQNITLSRRRNRAITRKAVRLRE